MIINDWRLTPGFLAFVDVVDHEKRVYLASRDNKADKNVVAKLIQDRPYTELTVDINELELKFEKLQREWITSPVGVFIRNPEIFPDDSWYRVMNFCNDTMFDIFLSLESNKGTFEGKIFEAIFSESSPNVVSFVCSEMPEYLVYFEEMKRRINCETNKKTKKWISGHRYDTIKETYFFLGEFASRKESLNNSEFKDNLGMATAYLYTNVITDKDKNISDIFKTRVFGPRPEDIKVIFSLPSAVESGAALTNDFEIAEIQNYWDVMLDNAVEACKINKSNNYIGYYDTYRIFEVLGYFSSWANLNYPEKIVSKFKSILGDLAFDALVEWYGIQRSDNNLTILSSKSMDDNKKSLERTIYNLTRDVNISKSAYYPALLKYMGIKMDKILEEALLDWDESRFCDDFDNYLKYSFYFDKRNSDLDLISRQRVNTTSYSIDIVTIEKLLGNGPLKNAVINLVNFAKDNHGAGTSKFAIYNTGTKKSPKEYISCEVTLRDVIDYMKDSISDELKSEIVKKKFTRIVVQADKDRELE
jgi:hypothetical protein